VQRSLLVSPSKKPLATSPREAKITKAVDKMRRHAVLLIGKTVA